MASRALQPSSIIGLLRYFLRLLARFPLSARQHLHIIWCRLWRLFNRHILLLRDAGRCINLWALKLCMPEPRVPPVICAMALPNSAEIGLRSTGYEMSEVSFQASPAMAPIHNISRPPPSPADPARPNTPASQMSRFSRFSHAIPLAEETDEQRGRRLAIRGMIEQEQPGRSRSRASRRARSKARNVSLAQPSPPCDLGGPSLQRQRSLEPSHSRSSTHINTLPPASQDKGNIITTNISTSAIESIQVEVPSRAASRASHVFHEQNPDPDRLTAGSLRSVNSSTSTVHDYNDNIFDWPFPRPHVPHRWLKEMTHHRDDFPRYTRRAVIPRKDNNVMRYSLDDQYPHLNGGDDTGPWVPVMHPEGPLYFYHQHRRVYTDAYMYKKEFQDEMTDFLHFLDECVAWFIARDGRDPLCGNRELVVEVGAVDTWKEDGPVDWKYYIVDHDSKSLLWMRDLPVSHKMNDDVEGAWSPSHFHLLSQSWYWRHWWLFPIGPADRMHPMTRSDFRRLSGLLDYFVFDGMVSTTSTNSYRTDELRWICDIVRHAEKQCKEEGGVTPEALATISRVQSWIAHWRFVNFHGQRAARLSVTESVHDEVTSRPRKIFIRVLSILLLFSPGGYLTELENVCVDGIVSVPAWHKYFKKLLDEWDRLVLQGTVILTANVSFLAIPDVLKFPGTPQSDTVGNTIQFYEDPLRSTPAILSYISTIVGLGSIVLGLLLTRQNRFQTEQSTDATTAFVYINQYKSEVLGLGFEPLAVLFSLPYALLLWATGLFLAALLSFAFSTTDDTTIIIVASSAGVVTMLTAWCVIAAWQPPQWIGSSRSWLYCKWMENWEVVTDAADNFKGSFYKLRVRFWYRRSLRGGEDQLPPAPA